LEEAFRIVEREFGSVIEAEERIPMLRIPSVMGRVYERIFALISAAGVVPAGAPYAVYLGVDWDEQIKINFLGAVIGMFTKKWHCRIGLPVSASVEGDDYLKPSFIGKREYAMIVHKGPYRGVGQTYARMYRWIREKGFSALPESMEVYLNDPRHTRKEELETEVLIPITRKANKI